MTETMSVGTTDLMRLSHDYAANNYDPLPVVIAHGLFATVTIVFVVLTALGMGGS